MVKRKTVKKNTQDRTVLWVIISLITIALAVIALFKLGLVGIVLSNFFSFVLGSYYWISLISLVGVGFYIVFLKNKKPVEWKIVIGVMLCNIALILLMAALHPKAVTSFENFWGYLSSAVLNIFDKQAYDFGGGLIGYFLYVIVYILFEQVGTYIVVAILFVISALLIVPMETYRKLFFDAKELHEQKASERKLARVNRQLEKEQKQLEQEKRRSSSFQNIELGKEETPRPVSRSSYFIDVDAPVQKESDSFVENEFLKTEEEKVSAPTSPVLKEEPQILTAKKVSEPYQLPPLSLLENVALKNSNINRSSAGVKGQKVIEILHNFGIEATLINTHIGPSVTKFEIKPQANVKVSKIQNISDNIKMELAAKDIRIEAPIPGRNAVGIEIPNVEPTPVRMLELMRQIPSEKKDSPLLFALGKDLLGKGVFCELDKMPHLLIAGATGAGKSVCINTIITSFLMRDVPEDLRMVLIDPKKVEFTPYHDVPHLLWPVITDATMASNMLKKIVVIMEERYDAFAEVGVRHIKGFNDFVKQHNASLKEEESPMQTMPFIVVIIDELADLMAIAGKEVELSIQRITQLARASGIHLIVATQRPSTDVITGIIKSNIPSRISFAVASSIDSRTILDQTGAERLLGNGDMLYAPQGENSPIRIQGVYVTDQEIKKITDHVKKQQSPIYEDSYYEFLNAANGGGSVSASAQKEEDGLFDEVVEYVTEAQKASTSLLQRRFGIGYNRAARLIDTLEERGIIGPAQGSKPREVYLKKQEE